MAKEKTHSQLLKEKEKLEKKLAKLETQIAESNDNKNGVGTQFTKEEIAEYKYLSEGEKTIVKLTLMAECDNVKEEIDTFEVPVLVRWEEETYATMSFENQSVLSGVLTGDLIDVDMREIDDWIDQNTKIPDTINEMTSRIKAFVMEIEDKYPNVMNPFQELCEQCYS